MGERAKSEPLWVNHMTVWWKGQSVGATTGILEVIVEVMLGRRSPRYREFWCAVGIVAGRLVAFEAPTRPEAVTGWRAEVMRMRIAEGLPYR